MNRHVAGLVLLLAGSMAIASPLEKIHFGNISFHHAWESKESIITHVYVEDSQTLDNWQHLVIYREYPGALKTENVLKEYLAEINPVQKPSIYQHGYKQGTLGRDYIIQFMEETPDSSYLEFVTHRFVLEGGTVRSYQFSARNFGRQLSELHEEVSANQTRWVELVEKLTAADFKEENVPAQQQATPEDSG